MHITCTSHAPTCTSHAHHTHLTCTSHTPHMHITCPYMHLTCTSHTPHMHITHLTCTSHAPTCTSHAHHTHITCTSHAPHTHITCTSHALSDVLSLSYRSSYYDLVVDSNSAERQKSSGVLVYTGTGSTSWYVRPVPYGHAIPSLGLTI